MVYKIVSLTESQVGKYIDVNGDGVPEGVIFADLAIGGRCQYKKSSLEKVEVEIPTIKEGLKDYIVVGEYEDKINGKQEVLSPILDGLDRFYIMALSDAFSLPHSWYTSAYFNPINNYNVITSQNFGTGKQNTLTMIEKWNNSTYGKKNGGWNPDMWNGIQNKVKEGWFIPSINEWIAFATNLKISAFPSVNGLNSYYWSSSLFDPPYAYSINLRLHFITEDIIGDNKSIRLITTY